MWARLAPAAPQVIRHADPFPEAWLYISSRAFYQYLTEYDTLDSFHQVHPDATVALRYVVSARLGLLNIGSQLHGKVSRSQACLTCSYPLNATLEHLVFDCVGCATHRRTLYAKIDCLTKKEMSLNYIAAKTNKWNTIRILLGSSAPLPLSLMTTLSDTTSRRTVCQAMESFLRETTQIHPAALGFKG